jgi:hypothetical protein
MFSQKKKYINFKYKPDRNPIIIVLNKYQNHNLNKYDLKNLGTNPNIDIASFPKLPKLFVDNYLIPYSYKFSNNPHLKIEEISKNHEKHDFCYMFDVSRNPCFSLSEILKNKENVNWDFNGVCCNPSVSLKKLLQYPELFQNLNFVSHNPNIKASDILEHPEFPWNWLGLSKNVSDILTHPELPWNWYQVSANFSIPISYIFENLDKHWNWNWISCNPAISIMDIITGIEKKVEWNWGNLSKHANIKINDILSYPGLTWDWNSLSQNPNIYISDILKNRQLPWNPYFVSKNPNITIRDILSDSSFFVPDGFLTNEFLWNTVVYKRELKSDIKKRREMVKRKLSFGDLFFVVEKYIGYV